MPGKNLIISIHALLAESDYDSSALMTCQVKFLSTLSLRRATAGLCFFLRGVSLFLSTLSLRRATKPKPLKSLRCVISIHALLAESDMFVNLRVLDGSISIHALLAESDPPRVASLFGRCYFYPRSPCGERLISQANGCATIPFLSTLSLRRATIHDFSALHDILISIHALLAESDNHERRKYPEQ